MLLSEISSIIQGELIGNPDCLIEGVSALSCSQEGQITFVMEPKFIAAAKTTPASAFIVFKRIEDLPNQIIVKDIRKAMAQVIALFYPQPAISPHISDQAFIHPSAKISDTCVIEPFVVIEEGASIGDRSVLKFGVTIGKHCQIGHDCMIWPHVVIYDHTVIGNHVMIHAGTVIGIDGFGYYPQGEAWGKIPHIGAVVIGDDVEIGGNTCIDRGCLGNTTIGNGTKIDNLVHIAHNSSIGEHCAITAFAGLSGGVTLEDHVMVAGQVGFNGHIRVGKNTTVLGRSGVTKNVPSNSFISGYPAQNHHQEMKEQALIRKMAKERIRNER